MLAEGFEYLELIDLEDVRLRRPAPGEPADVVLVQHLVDWIEDSCAGEALIYRKDLDYFVAFNNETDATLFHGRFARSAQ